MEEQWKPIPNASKYLFSNYGRIKKVNGNTFLNSHYYDDNNETHTINKTKLFKEVFGIIFKGRKELCEYINKVIPYESGYGRGSDKHNYEIEKPQAYNTKAIREIKKMIIKYGMNTDEILSNRNNYKVIILNTQDNSVKYTMSIDEFEKMFYDDKQMFIDYLKLISTGKINGKDDELWYIKKVDDTFTTQ